MTKKQRTAAATTPSATVVIAAIGDALVRLDTRRHIAPAQLELSRTATRNWTAMIMADPLTRPLVGWGAAPFEAMYQLALAIEDMDWRRVRR